VAELCQIGYFPPDEMLCIEPQAFCSLEGPPEYGVCVGVN
jgi:hypothetical protein